MDRKLIAPLLNGRAPVRDDVQQDRSRIGEMVGGGLFVLALAGILAAAWWFACGDRQFREQTAARYSLPPGQSLDELNVPAGGEPMNMAGRSTTDPGKMP